MAAADGSTGRGSAEALVQQAISQLLRQYPSLTQRILTVAQQQKPKLDAYAQRHAENMFAQLLGEDGLALLGDPRERKERAEANLRAMSILAGIHWADDNLGLPWQEAVQREAADIEALSEASRSALRRYSGWGGVGIQKYTNRFPANFPKPEAEGLIHEYYTPSFVAEAIGRAIAPLLPGLVATDGKIHALEPSAGVGRMVQGLDAASPMEEIDWTLVEFSKVSGRLLRALYGDRVHQMPFERWVAYNAPKVAGSLNLILSNPPYGPRGPSHTEDPDTNYYSPRAYLYFLRRSLDLLAPGGLGVYLVPAGWLTAKGREMRKWREMVLRRHHLSCAFRLPSVDPQKNDPIFPGAQLVVDILFFRARPGELAEPDPNDAKVLAGDYFKQYPQHLLGKEDGDEATDQPVKPEEGKKPKRRWGYQVVGEWKGLPPLVERPACDGCVIRENTERKQAKYRGGIARVIEEVRGLPGDLADAVRLGLRVDQYLGQVATGSESALVAWPELVRDLHAWRDLHGAPKDRAALRELADGRRLVGAQRFLSAWTARGDLIPALAEEPKIQRRYIGAADLLAEADWLYRQEQGLTLSRLMSFHEKNSGMKVKEADALERLLAAGWCLDGEDWKALVPSDVYLTGSLWPKFDLAQLHANEGDKQAQKQIDLLLRAIKPAKWLDLVDDLSPRESWLPPELVSAWLKTLSTAYKTPVLKREDGLLRLEGVDYDTLSGNKKDAKVMEGVASPQVIWFVGWANHDNGLFRPAVRKYFDDGEERTETVDMARLRVAQGGDIRNSEGKWIATTTGQTERPNWIDSFRDWVRMSPTWHATLENAYNRQLKGFVQPTYTNEAIHIARWNPEAPRLYPYQAAGVRRLQANRSGILAYDVGMGKTYTGIATLALARQEGWATRPVVVVPNSIIWKWHRDFQRVLPDYRVLVIGSKRGIVQRGAKKGKLRAEPDTPKERAEKWATFQAGQAEVVLLTYSALGRTKMDPALLEAYGEKTSAIRRLVELSKEKEKERFFIQQKKDLRWYVIEKNEKGKVENEYGPFYSENAARLQAKDVMGQRTERQEAVKEAGVKGWIGKQLQPPKDWAYDPGIDWHQLGVDFLMVDEAQNFKGLFGPEEREGGMPDSMGSSESSKRAWQLDFRCASVRERTGGGGIVLLSATPAKNGPVEFYNMIHLINPKAWEQVGIADPESFIDRYCDFSTQPVLKANGQLNPRQACTGFKNLDEIRSVIFRYGEFLTPDQVGLKVPEAIPKQQYVDLSGEQQAKIDALFDEAQKIIDAMKRSAGASEGQKEAMRMKMQSLAMRAYSVGVHPSLPDINPRYDDEGVEIYPGLDPETVDPHSPKIDAVVETILGMGNSYGYGSVSLRGRREPQACDTDGENCIACGHIIFGENVATHVWMKKALVEAGYDPARIAVLNAKEAADPETRQQIAIDFCGEGKPGDEDYEPPIYDIVIANAVAYEGVDLQKRTCAIHHLDVPWEPATLQQRNGRGVRQGNRFEAVEVHYYFAKDSADGFRVGKIQNKRAWMVSLLKSQDRTTNNLSAGEKMSPIELLATIAPPEARAKLMAQIESAKEDEKRAKEGRIRVSASKLLEKINGRFRDAEMMGDPAEAQRLREEGESLLEDLGKFDAAVWPHHQRALAVRHQAVLVVDGNTPPLVMGQKFRGRNALYELGRWGMVYDASAKEAVLAAYIRKENTVSWEAISGERLAYVLNGATESDVDPLDWVDGDLAGMQRALELKLKNTMRYGANWQPDLGWHQASPTWQQQWWPTIEQNMVANFRPYEAAVPYINGDKLGLWTAGQLPTTATLIPPTEQGWRQFLGMAPTFDPKGERRFTRLSEAGEYWWDRKIPRNLLSAA